MSARFAPAFVLASFFLIVSPILAQQESFIPRAQDRPPGPALSPSEAIAKMTVPSGFTVELVASEPDIVNPVAMTFDERGRVWITESLEYPRRSPGPGKDRVKILEDTDGDGKADKFTVFADGLNIPSGIAVGAGGVWVANSPDILFLKDTDGDGKADTREVIVTGFGRDDTHELPNSLTWGPDGYLYGWNGVFNPARIDYRGKHYEFTCAVFRIDPKTRDFEVFCEGTSNPWGITWDKEGSAFASACVIDHLWHLTETGYYHRQGGPYPPFTWKLESIVDHKHQKAAYCGITYFDSDAYPEKYRERLFMGNIHGNGINVDRLERRGATYRGVTEPDFLQANDAWFMPVVQKTGPDGSLYVLDWYDRYHCYQDANRDPAGIDRLKGRLYRVRYKDTPRATKFNLAGESDDQLIGRLSSPNIYYRETAQRILRERDGGDARRKLQSLIVNEKSDRKGRMHALWTLIGTGRLEPGLLERLLDDRDPTIRAWAVRAAGNFRKVDPVIVKAVLKLAYDPSPDVKVQVAIASRKLEGVDPLPTLIGIIDHGGPDTLVGPIIWQNLHPLLPDRAEDFVKIVAHTKLESTPYLVGLLPRAIDRLLGGSNPRPEAAVALLSQLLATRQEGAVADASQWSLEIVAERLRVRSMPKAQLAILHQLLPKALSNLLAGDPDAPLSLDAALIATAWKDPAALKAVGGAFISPRTSKERRLQALDALIDSGDPTVLDVVGPALADRKAGTSAFRGQMLASLGRLDSPEVAKVVMASYPRLEPDLQPKAVELLTQRVAWTKVLLDAVERKVVPTSALSVNQIRLLGSMKHPDVAERVKAIFGTFREGRNPAREQVIESIRGKLKEAHGDPVAGQVVFRNVCGQCHKIYGEGQEVGPDVTLNGRGSYEQLLSNVFDPSLVIGPGYQATTVATTDGRVLNGLVVEDSPQRIVLKLQGGKLETVAKSAVEESRLSPLSLMPEALETQITPKELADLFAFITLDKSPGDGSAQPIPGTPSGIRK
jgi:putative membrane-bound dehydrogenase-like protein